MMDVPGLIEGAAEGAGLGIRFLKHLQRTRILLHLVDVLPPDEADIAANFRKINLELKKFNAGLARREKWLVFNKIDLLGDRDAKAYCEKFVKKLNWKGRWFVISAVAQKGTKELCQAVQYWLDDKAAGKTAKAPRTATKKKTVKRAPAKKGTAQKREPIKRKTKRR